MSPGVPVDSSLQGRVPWGGGSWGGGGGVSNQFFTVSVQYYIFLNSLQTKTTVVD